MALYAIGDLHLSLSTGKPMDIFGEQWKDHVRKLRNGFAGITPDDTVVLCGDLSWGMTMEESLEDFRLINALPGKKLIVKGNHDYWWTTAAKMRAFFSENGLSTLTLLHNNSFECDGIAVCGTRGWFVDERTGTDQDRKVLLREVGRLRMSLEAAGDRRKAVFLHYPPVYGTFCCEEILQVLREYGVRHCYYGHIHGKSIAHAFNGWENGTEFRLISADSLGFQPMKIELP